MKLSNIPVQKLLLEFTAILISIILALAIDQWQQDRETEQKANLAQEKIFREIKANFEELKRFQKIVKSRYEKLLSIEDEVDDTQGFHQYISKFTGYRFTELNSSAWQRANNGILANYMDEEFTEQALHLYNWNKTLQTFHLKMNDFIYQPYFFDPKQAKYAWYISKQFKGQQIGWANSMIEDYEQFILTFEDQYEDRTVTTVRVRKE